MSFSDLMKKPLPSQMAKIATESTETEDEFNLEFNADIMTESEYVLAVIDLADVVLESFEDTDIYTEGANWDLHKKYRADLKKFKECMQTTKKHLKNGESEKAKKEIDDGIEILKKCQKEALDDIKEVKDNDIINAICGRWMRAITFTCKAALLVLTAGVGSAIGGPVGIALQVPANVATFASAIKDDILMIKKWINEGFTIKSLNTYINFVEDSYKKMIDGLEKFRDKIDDAKKENDDMNDMKKEETKVESAENVVETEVETAEEETAMESVQDEIDEMLAFIATESEDAAAEMEALDKEIDNMSTEDSDDNDEIVDDKEYDDEADDLDDIDLSGLSDEELDELEDELRDSDLDDAAGDVEPVELTADEEREADDLMSLAGTTELLKSELNVEERARFLESATETQIAVYEGFLLESDVLPVSEGETDEVMTEAKLYNKTTIRFSKEDRKAQLYAVALNVSARAHNDPDFIKLQRVQKVRRILKRRIQKKYHAEAIRRMKVYFNRLRSSKSSVLAAIGKKIAGNKD